MEVLGKVIVLGETQTVGSAGTFRKRTIVVETDEQYKQTIPIDFIQDKCEILNSYKEGDNVKVGINIRGNLYQGKYYVSLNGWNISNTETVSTTVKSTEVFKESNDLPF